MSDHLKQTIADLESRLSEKLAEVAKIRDTINRVAELAGESIPYPEVAEPESRSGGPIRPDEFYGKALHTAMRAFIEKRGQLVGPATVNEIYEAMVKGGYQFDTANDANAKRVIRITLTKNSGVFHKLPNGSYGLLVWYPGVKKPKKSEATESAGTDETNTTTDDADEESEDAEGDSQ